MPENSTNGNAFIRRTAIGRTMKRLSSPAFVAATAALMLAIGVAAQSQQSPQPSPMDSKTAGEYYKNIQVLKDVPASQLIPGMRYITTALGVECSYCHVQGNFAADDKQPKQTARKMMTMLFTINKNNFDGRQEVSCFTCHQGHHEPMGVPALPAEATEPQFSRLAAGAPTLTAVLDKFTQAQGREDAVDKVNTRAITMQVTHGDQTSSAQLYQKAPGKMYAVMNTPRGSMTMGFDGTRGWTSTNEGTREASGPEAEILRTEAQINPSAAIAAYKPKRLFGTAKIGDAEAYIVFATAPDGSFELDFFDQQSGLLIRRMIRYRTIFGALPVEADYSDYRSVDGVSIPFKTVWYMNGQTVTYTITDVKDNVPVDDSKFEPPQKSQ
ncbi:MAG TPA: c-type cytochrome [Candidatus Sulfotelmatobacter sp.]|nr:c-type cytochrome [Candidatus Sulfotelmatobacter sp.]